MKYVLIVMLAMFSLSTQARGTDCDYNTSGCVLKQYKEVDLRTMIDNDKLAGFLWNDGPRSAGKPVKEIHKKGTRDVIYLLEPRKMPRGERLAFDFTVDCSKSYRWGCRINPR